MKRKVLYLSSLVAIVLSSCTISFGSSNSASQIDSDTSSDSDPSSSETISDVPSTTSSENSSDSSSTLEEGWDNYYLPDEVDPYHSYQDLKMNVGIDAVPSPRTDIDILVIPIEFTDYSFSSKTLADIEILFNGTPSQTKYWESVSSFYEKSSYGNQVMDFTVAPKYNTGLTASQASRLDTSYTQYFSTNLLRSAVDNYKLTNGSSSTRQFDADGNGYIDAVWMIYSCPNHSNSPTIKNISEDFWAYVFWDYYDQSSSTTSPNPNAYAWASYDFMYEGGGTNKVDAHTYIHETGHLLGLDDYYNYDENSTYKPLGAIDMMDYNVGDHNAWSKMALGWLKPYVVTGDAQITINPVESSGDAILIADNWNGTSFDEFLLLELITPTGLNDLDSKTIYADVYPRVYTQPGIRLLHIDSRLGIFNYYGGFIGYGDPGDLPLYNDSTQRYFDQVNSNTPSRSVANPDYRLVHMIQAGGTNTFDTGYTGTYSDLFRTGMSFSMANYGSEFFENGNKLNNGNSLGYTIDFINVNLSSATIRVNKI